MEVNLIKRDKILSHVRNNVEHLEVKNGKSNFSSEEIGNLNI